jgi:geranylgeranyl diphosphate synthase type II
MDDLLDAYGDKESFGKRLFGDIHANKKTFLYLKALELADDEDNRKLRWFYSDNDYQVNDKVGEVKKIFDKLNVREHTIKLIDVYHDRALDCLKKINADEKDKKVTRDFTGKLMERKY